MKKKITAAVLCLVTAMLMLTPFYSSAMADPDIHYTHHCCVANSDTGEIIFEKGSKDRVAPAGTAKMMTALLALEHYGENLSQTVTVSAEAVDAAAGISCGLTAGTSVLVSDLLAAVIIGGYNDAALVLACEVSGSIGEFVKLMNSRAAELGMEDTNFVNPTGLDESGAYTSAYDVTLLGQILAVMPVYTKFSDSPSYVLSSITEGLTIYNRNMFISTYYNLNYFRDSTVGLCSGKTESGGQCVCAADKTPKGFTFVITVMGADEPEVEPFRGCIPAYEDAIDLMKWAAKSFDLFTVVNTADMICEVPVTLSSSVDHVILLPAERVNVVFPVDVDLDDEITYDWKLKTEELTAPIKDGEVVGELTVISKTRGVLGTVDLISKNNVERSPWLFFWSKVGAFLSNPFVLVLLALALIFIVFIIIVMSRYIARKHRRVRYRTPKDKR